MANMVEVHAPKQRDMTITVKAGKGRSPMPRPSQTHRDKPKHSKKYACRNKGRRRREDW